MTLTTDSAGRCLSNILTALAVLLVVSPAVTASATEGKELIEVWPGPVPGELGDIEPERVLPAREDQPPVTRITNVTRATLTVFRASDDSESSEPNPAVLICPGGGYNILAWDKEGTEVAEWLNSIGVTGIVLKYRVPRRKDREKHLGPLQDAQRAMSLVRSRSRELGIDSNRIGILGFSAGGHLSAATSTNFEDRQYEQIDLADETSCRPDFTVLVYPAYMTADKGLQPEIPVTERTPPAFLAHAGDDRISSENSIRYYLSLKRAGVAAELHIYDQGGHGFGLRKSELPVSRWPDRCEQWLRTRKIIQ